MQLVEFKKKTMKGKRKIKRKSSWPKRSLVEENIIEIKYENKWFLHAKITTNQIIFSAPTPNENTKNNKNVKKCNKKKYYKPTRKKIIIGPHQNNKEENKIIKLLKRESIPKFQ